ncbi:MAG: hypothetical protein WCO60_06195 [Verrucomicrobiota bacterium]
MNHSHFSIQVARWCFLGVFFVVLGLGGYLVAKRKALFGEDLDVPGDSEGARGYNAMQVFALWAHALALSGAFAFGLH